MNQKNYWKISLKDLTLSLSVGICEHEKIQPQKIIINCNIYIDYLDMQNNTKIQDVLNYDELLKEIQKKFLTHTDILEDMAEKIIDIIFSLDNRVKVAEVEIQKPYIYNGLTIPTVFLHRTKNI